MTDYSARLLQDSISQKSLINQRLTAADRWRWRMILAIVWTLAIAFQASAHEISNDTLTMHLNVSPEGIPIIEDVVWKATGQVAFRDLGTPDGLIAWIPETLLPIATPAPVWTITEGDAFTTAEATRNLANKMRLTWVVELPKEGQLFRLHLRLTNNGKQARAVTKFPAWSANWDAGGQSQWARSWQSLAYSRTDQTLSTDRTIQLGSHLHSSDDSGNGVTPYWVVGGPASRIYFSLQWCGGWSASLRGLDNGFAFSVNLPAEATQLVINRNEAIDGPALLVTPVLASDDTAGRMVWMRQRHELGQMLYGGPQATFPLTYNHWYAARQNIDSGFMDRQMAAMTPYGFNAFVIDAGWYADGNWKPNKSKFPPDYFVNMMAGFKANGIAAGLWTTPQYVSDSSNSADLAIEDSMTTNRFFNGFLVDMASSNFTGYLNKHIGALRKKFSMDYWKYDQAFFIEQSRAGQMKDVLGLQKGLQAVRQSNPDLFIENCQSGGRMINDFTLLATQTSWLRDNNINGLDSSLSNVSVTLGALDIAFPWSALRFTSNLEQIDGNDDEATRLYCRSAMAGVWGLSTDLSLIGERQQGVILKEIQNYRRLGRLKFSCLYDLQLPGDGVDVAGVTFYNGWRTQAGVLLYRWQGQGDFNKQIKLAKLRPEMMYRVSDMDTGTEITASGSDLMTNGVTVPFGSGRLSALLFVKDVKDPPEE